MKIEIDIDELTALKNSVSDLSKKNSELLFKIDSLNEKSLIAKYEEKAMRTAIFLANNYLDLIFVKLGFEKSTAYDGCLELTENFSHWLGNDWWYKDERIKVDISARVYNDFRKLVLKLRIIPKEDLNNVFSVLEMHDLIKST